MNINTPPMACLHSDLDYLGIGCDIWASDPNVRMKTHPKEDSVQARYHYPISSNYVK